MGNSYKSLTVIPEKCAGHMQCVRVCPAEAIRVRNERVVMLDDRCIECGECIKACTRGAIVALTDSFADFSRFRHLIAVPSPVIFGQFHHEVLPPLVIEAFRHIGFQEVADVSRACEMVNVAIEEFLEKYRGPLPLISSFCPTVVRLVQTRYPLLAELLIPVESPMEIAAREAKQQATEQEGLAAEEVGAIYITPCPSKMVAIHDSPRKSRTYLDGALSVSEIFSALFSKVLELKNRVEISENKIYGCGIGWAILGGQLRALKAENSLAVAGIQNVIRIFEDIENGRLRDVKYIECHSCVEGCVSGSLNVENPYFARSMVIRLLEKYGEKPKISTEEIRELFNSGYFSLKGPITIRPMKALDEDVKVAIEKMQQRDKLLAQLPGKHCAACGAPSCRAFAEDVVLGKAKIDDCPFKFREKLKKLAQGLLDQLEK